MSDTTVSAGIDQVLSPQIPIIEAHKTPCHPQNPPSVIDWEHFRPIITNLYLCKGYTLSAVQRKLAGSYDFKASQRAYKVKLRHWGMHKNYRVLQEYSTTDTRSTQVIEKGTDGTISVSSCALAYEGNNGSMDQKAEGQSARSAYVDSSTLGPKSSLRASTHRSTSSIVEGSVFPPIRNAKLSISHKFVSCSSLEAVLVSTRLFSKLVLGSEIGGRMKHGKDSNGKDSNGKDSNGKDSRRLQASQTGDDHTFITRSWRYTEYLWSKFHRGLSLLEENKSQEGFENLHQGCNLVHDFLSRQPRHSLSSLFIHMGNHRWSRHAKVRRSLLKFLFGMSSDILGRQHPLSVILCAIHIKDDLINDYAELALKVMLDTAATQVNATYVEVLRIKLCYCVVLARQNEHTLSEALIKSTCCQSEQQKGETSVATRQCLRRLANLHVRQGRLEEAEAIFEDVIRRQPSNSKPLSPDELSIYTYRNLALLCAERGNFANSDYWFKKELDAALISWGPQDAYYHDCCATQILRLQGNASGLLGLNWPEID